MAETGKDAVEWRWLATVTDILTISESPSGAAIIFSDLDVNDKWLEN